VRGLVLGGGGITGIAWMIGVLAGLADRGIDLTDADVVVGTSAGSIVGSLIATGPRLEDLYAHQLTDPAGEIAARFRTRDMLRYLFASLLPGGEERIGRRIGRMAIGAKTKSDDLRREVIAERLGNATWPARTLLITTVDADTGAARVFDAASGVPLVDAVRASCSVPMVWPPVTIDGHRYMDGGVRSIANADLAKGCERIVVLAPVNVATRRRTRIETQLASLGPSVRSIVLSPDAAARQAIGPNVLSPITRAASARAGRAQGAGAADTVREVWLG